MSTQRSPHRRILHIDMDAFYASVEQRDDPSLKGRPVAVGGDPSGRGVVAAASYEARAFGVRSAIPMARAVRLCPQLVIVRPAFERYRAVSNTVFDIFRSITPLVEPLSLDEAYLDVTENAWGEPLGMRVAERLKGAIRESTGLTASAGVAPNKFLAKIASGWHKPDGLTVIAPERVESFLQGLPIDALWGVGPVTARRLRAQGIEKLVDVRLRPIEELRDIVGSAAEWLQQLARGDDDRPVEPNRPRKSVGSENTFARDLLELTDIRKAVDEIARDVAAWLTRKAVFGRTVTLKIRYSDFTTCTRSGSDPRGTQNADAIAARALALLEKTEAGRRPVRLLGVSVHNLQEVEDSVAPRAVSWSPGLPFEEDGAQRPRPTDCYDPLMLKGTRDAILRKVQPISIHGQISWDLYFADVDDPEGPIHAARVGPETVSHRLEPGDRIRLEYVLGSVIGVTKLQP